MGEGTDTSQGCHHPSLPLPTLLWLRKLTHNTQEQEGAGPHDGLSPGSARKGGLSELTLLHAPTSALSSLPQAIPSLPHMTPSHLFAKSWMRLMRSSPVQPVSGSLSYLVVHLPVCPFICRPPESQLSRCHT